MQKYLDLALKLKATHALAISPDEVFFDPRAKLKCLWGCADPLAENNLKCGSNGLSLDECREMIKRYQNIILVHAHDVRLLSHIVIALERRAFLDGHYFAFAVRTCNLCRNCRLNQGGDCRLPSKRRPCDQTLGVDVYKTVREQGLPCQVLQNKDDRKNLYGFVLVN